MPRDGANQYSIPPGSDGAPNTTIVSAKYNLFIHDVESDLNLARPIVAGGTGANSASGARANLKAEVSMQVVTDFLTQVWEAGSFAAGASTTNAPTTNAQAGVALVIDANNVIVRSTDRTTGITYTRSKVAGVWGSTWNTTDGSDKVAKAGDTMTGDLTISKVSPSFVLDAAVATQSVLWGRKATQTRWAIILGDTAAESGSDAGSNFLVARYHDNGTFIDVPLTISRQSGLISPGPAGIANVVRYDAAQALTAAQQAQARANVYAAPLDALAYNGLQINGTMSVAQDPASIAGASGSSLNAYVCDVWKSLCFGTGKTFATGRGDGALVGSFFNHYLVTSISAGAGGAIGATDQGRFAQFVPTERIRRLNWGTGNAQPLTISFWIGSSVTGTMCVSVTNTPPANRSYVVPVAIVGGGGGWNYYTVTIPGDTTGTWFGTENGVGAVVSFSWLGGSNFQTPTPNAWLAGNFQTTTAQSDLLPANGNSIAISGAMFHPGGEAPSSLRQPLLARPFEDDLRAVLRQFWYHDWGNASYNRLVGAYQNTNPCFFSQSFPVQMRAVPTQTFLNPTGFGVNTNGTPSAVTSFLNGTLTVDDGSFFATSTAACTTNFGAGRLVGGAGCAIKYDARL